jgi:hypothetical protein
MLNDKLITIEDLKLFKESSYFGPHSNFGELLSDNGVKALKDGLIKIEDAPYCQDLRGMLSERGMYLLENGLISRWRLIAMNYTV